MKDLLTILKVLLCFLAVIGLLQGLSHESFAAKKVVKIGNIDPYTGPAAALGIGKKNSMDLRIRQANASGEFPNYNIQLVALDDASDPATGVSMATKLGSDPDVIGTSAHYNSTVALATIHVFHRFGLLNIPNAAHPDIIRGNNYPEIIRIIADIPTEQTFGADFLVGKFGYKRWSVVNDTTSWGKSRLEWFKKDLETRPETKLLSEDGVNTGTKDFRPILTKIKELKPQAIFAGLLTQEAALLKLQMHELGMDNILFFGSAGLDSETFHEIVGKIAEGTVINGQVQIPQDSPFAKAYKAAGYSAPFETYGPFAYDAAGIILEALKKVGPNRKAIVEYVNRPDFQYQGITHNIKLNNRQTLTGGLVHKVSQDGKWVLFENSEYATGKRKLPGK